MKKVPQIKSFLLVTLLIAGNCRESTGQVFPAPVISPISEWCFNDKLTLTHNANGYSEYQHYWEYGVYVDRWYPNGDFGIFINSVVGLVLQYYTENPELCPGCEMYKISVAANNTDYQYMNAYYYMNADQNSYKYQIVQLILDGIGVQNNAYLSEMERAILTSSGNYITPYLNFLNSFPNYPVPEILSWNPLGVTNDASIEKTPADFLSAYAGRIQIGIKVRISDGPFGPVENIYIKPKPPDYDVAGTASCPNSESGSITLTEITGLFESDYSVNVRKENEESGIDRPLQANTYTVNQPFGPGRYFVNLYYNNVTHGDCSYEKEVIVDAHPDLNFDITPYNAKCAGSADGEIKVEITLHHLDYRFSLATTYLDVNTNGIFSGLPAGTFKVKATDACHGTPIEKEVTIGQPPAVTINSIIKTDPTCNSIPNGGFSINASGGNNQFTYQIVNAQNAIVASADNKGSEWTCSVLTGGNYTVRVSSGGCTPVVSAVQALAIVTPVTFTTSVIDVDCYGMNTGSIGVTASGGNKDYRYSTDNVNFTTSDQFKDLSSGNYNIWVKTTASACNDIASGNVFVGTASKIEIGFSQLLNPTCFEKDDGKITASVTGGTGPYSYSWEQSGGFPVPGSSNTIENLYSETYRVNIRDSKNCTESKEAALTDPPELVVLSATPTDAVCFGQNGSINVQAAGGSGGYLYSKNESAGFTGSPTLNLPTGDYGIYVKDANGCLASYGETLTITGPVAPLDFTYTSPEFNSFNIACSGNATGSLSVLASGGNGLKNDGSSYTGYAYSLAGSLNQPSSLFSGLRAGSFNLKVTDGRGCIVQKQVTLTEPDPLNLNLVSSIPVKCSGDATGELIVAASGGIENTWVYSLDRTEMLTTGIFKNLQARTYEIQVTDLNGCSKNMFAAVESPYSPINIAAVKKDVTCFGEGNGEITVSVAGGAGNFSYQWEKKSGESWIPIGGTMSDRTNMLPGIYRVRAIDKENCFRYESAEVSEPPILQITGASTEDIKCFGETGSLHIAGTGGIGDYKYLYSSGGIIHESAVPDIIVPAGGYSISMKDANGCLVTHPSTVTITSPLEPLSFNYALSAYAGYNISCHGKEDGIINVLATGGNGSVYSGYSYSISGGIPGHENVFTGVKAGTYDITVSDARGCSLSKPVTLVEPASFITLGASSIKQPVCSYDNNGAVTLEASGGASPYTYSVNGSDFTASAEFPGLKADSYTFRVHDNNGCAESFSTQLTNIISEMNVEGNISAVKCYGENSGEINVAVSGGAKPYSYSWTNAPSTTSRADRLKTGNYTVLITDSAGCISEKMFFVNQPEKSLSITAVSSPACVELEDGIITATGSGGTQPYSIALGNRSAMGISSSFNAYSGDHKVYISDYNGCFAETSVNVGVKNTLPDINFMLATSRYELDTLVVIDVSDPPPDRVTWEFSPEANIIETGNNKAIVKYSSAGLYPVKMTGFYGSCTYTIEKLLNIAPFDPSVLPDNDQRDGIRSVRISPNPNDGRFELKVELYTRQKVTVRIFDMSSRILFTEIYPPDVTFLKEITLPETIMPGTYVLRLTSENDSRTVVFVISE